MWQCLTSDNVYEILKLPENETLNRTMFYRSATIIISFVHQLTNSCDVSNHRNWSQLSYDLFSDQVLELSSALAGEDHDHDHDHDHDDHDDDQHHDDDDHDGHHDDEDEEHAEKYFTHGQLEHLLRLIAVSYQPGRSAALHSSLSEEQLNLFCSFGNVKVCLLIVLIYVLIRIYKN